MPTFLELLRDANVDGDWGRTPIRPPAVAPAQNAASPETHPVTGDKPGLGGIAPSITATPVAPGTEYIDPVTKSYMDAITKISGNTGQYYNAAKDILGPFDEKAPQKSDYVKPTGLPGEMSTGEALGLGLGAIFGGNAGSLMEGYQTAKSGQFNRAQGRYQAEEGQQKDYDASLRNYHNARHQYRQNLAQIAGQQMTDARGMTTEIFRSATAFRQQDVAQQRNEVMSQTAAARARQAADNEALKLFMFNQTEGDKIEQRKFNDLKLQSQKEWQAAQLARQQGRDQTYAQHMTAMIQIDQERLKIMEKQVEVAASRALTAGPAAAARALQGIGMTLQQLQFEQMTLQGQTDASSQLKLAQVTQTISKLMEIQTKLASQMANPGPGQSGGGTSQAPPNLPQQIPAGMGWEDPTTHHVWTRDGNGQPVMIR